MTQKRMETADEEFLAAGSAGDDLAADPLSPDLELLDRGGAIGGLYVGQRLLDRAVRQVARRHDVGQRRAARRTDTEGERRLLAAMRAKLLRSNDR